MAQMFLFLSIDTSSGNGGLMQGLSTTTTAIAPDPVRTASESRDKRNLLDNLFYIQARFPDVREPNDYYQALSPTPCSTACRTLGAQRQTFKDVRCAPLLPVGGIPARPHLASNLLNLGKR